MFNASTVHKSALNIDKYMSQHSFFMNINTLLQIYILEKKHSAEEDSLHFVGIPDQNNNPNLDYYTTKIKFTSLASLKMRVGVN